MPADLVLQLPLMWKLLLVIEHVGRNIAPVAELVEPRVEKAVTCGRTSLTNLLGFLPESKSTIPGGELPPVSTGQSA